MLFRSPLTTILGPGALLLLVGATAAGCGGCNDPALVCDESGENCQICDAYGCHDADPDDPTGGGASGGGGSGQGGAGGAGGGLPACNPEVTTCACADDAACPDGLQCIEGLCLAGCDFSYECGSGKVCVNGQCGIGCDDQTPCAEAGTTCVNGACAPDAANPACDAQTSCPEAGDVCVDGVCKDPCATNADCQAGEVCNAETGACMIDPSPDPGCAGGIMCGGVGQVCWADGYCHYECVDVMACQLIDSRFVACDEGICKTKQEVDPECTIDDPCPNDGDCIDNTCF